MKWITVHRRTAFWDILDGGSFDTLAAAVLWATRMAKLQHEDMEVEVVHCNRNTYDFDSRARPFVIGEVVDGVFFQKGSKARI